MSRREARIESGPWVSVGDPVSGPQSHALLAERYQGRIATRPYCVYVHVPFCADICSFCALYTRAVSSDRHDVFEVYLASIEASLRNHPLAGTLQSPTTVHFGGGTPLHLGLTRFGRLVGRLREAFGNANTCEWALETTTSSIDRASLESLQKLGIYRIHLGIQTLNDTVRPLLGRKELGTRTLDKIVMLREAGFNVTVDVILGLDRLDEADVLQDIRRLYESGIRMFSICELRPRGGIVVSQSARLQTSMGNYKLWQSIWNYLGDQGLTAIHLGQFGHSQQDNLYFTYPARDEDCLALGPYAHGVAGTLYYGNKLAPDYYASAQANDSVIAGGIVYSAPMLPVREIERHLLAHFVPVEAFQALIRAYADATSLLESWLNNDLLRVVPAGFQVTCEGSWFLGNLISQLRALAESAPAAGPGLRQTRREMRSLAYNADVLTPYA